MDPRGSSYNTTSHTGPRTPPDRQHFISPDSYTFEDQPSAPSGMLPQPLPSPSHQWQAPHYQAPHPPQMPRRGSYHQYPTPSVEQDSAYTLSPRSLSPQGSTYFTTPQGPEAIQAWNVPQTQPMEQPRAQPFVQPPPQYTIPAPSYPAYDYLPGQNQDSYSTYPAPAVASSSSSSSSGSHHIDTDRSYPSYQHPGYYQPPPPQSHPSEPYQAQPHYGPAEQGSFSYPSDDVAPASWRPPAQRPAYGVQSNATPTVSDHGHAPTPSGVIIKEEPYPTYVPQQSPVVPTTSFGPEPSSQSRSMSEEEEGPLTLDTHVPLEQGVVDPSASSPTATTPTPKPKRRRADPTQLRVLNDVYARTAFPSTEERIELGKRLNMSPRQVQIWFQNRRQNAKAGRNQPPLSPSDFPGSPEGSSTHTFQYPPSRSGSSMIKDESLEPEESMHPGSRPMYTFKREFD